MHRDLKTDNILLDKDYNLKLIDWEYAKTDIIQFDTYTGTKRFMAPEVVFLETFPENYHYTGEPVDVFAFGIIAYILVLGDFPFGKASFDDIWYKRFVEQRTLVLKELRKKHKLSVEFVEFLDKVLSHDPKERLPAEKIKELAWMKQPSLTDQEFKDFFDHVKDLYDKAENMQDFLEIIDDKFPDFVKN